MVIFYLKAKFARVKSQVPVLPSWAVQSYNMKFLALALNPVASLGA